MVDGVPELDIEIPRAHDRVGKLEQRRLTVDETISSHRRREERDLCNDSSVI